jgi:ankyrin repeat protein
VKRWFLSLAPVFVVLFLGGAHAAARQIPLIDAAKSGDIAAVRALLPAVDVNAAQDDGTTALHWAVHRDDLAMVDLLLKEKANVKAANRYGITPIALAATNGSARVVERLLNAGASANEHVGDGETVLMAAARSGHADAVTLLLARGADVNARDTFSAQTALMWAASRANVPVIKALIEAGADVNAKTPAKPRRHPNDQAPFTKALDAGGQSGYTWQPLDPTAFSALLFAVREGHIDAVKALLDGGADVNEMLSDGMAPLLLAVTNAHYELAAYLIDRGADPNANATGWTALHQAVRNRRINTRFYIAPVPTGRMSNLDLIKKLLESGARTNMRMWRDGMWAGRTRFNALGATPFLIAAKIGDLEVMKLLVANGADAKIATIDNLTPLMAAAGVELYNPGEDAGSNPEHLPERLEAVKYCVERGNDVNAADWDNETALHGAVYLGSPAVAEFLIEKGAQLDVKNVRGWTPLTMANGAQYTEFYKEQPAVAAVLRRAMTARGLSTDNQVADPTLCVDCYTTRGEEAGRAVMHSAELASKKALVEELKNAR